MPVHIGVFWGFLKDPEREKIIPRYLNSYIHVVSIEVKHHTMLVCPVHMLNIAADLYEKTTNASIVQC